MTKEGYQPVKDKKTVAVIPPNTGSHVKMKDCWKSCEYANTKAELIGQHIEDVQKLTEARNHIHRLLVLLTEGKRSYAAIDEARAFLREVLE